MSKTEIPTDCSVIQLSPNDYKGYVFEMEIQNWLHGLNFEFIGNPKDPIAWKRNISYGEKNNRSEPDIIMPQFELAIECKSVYSHVWVSGIQENYVDRFHGEKHKVVLTNDLKMYNKKCREKLRNAGIKLLDKFQFLHYVIDLLGIDCAREKSKVDAKEKLRANSITNRIYNSLNCNSSISNVLEYYNDPLMVVYDKNKWFLDLEELFSRIEIRRESEEILDCWQDLEEVMVT